MACLGIQCGARNQIATGFLDHHRHHHSLFGSGSNFHSVSFPNRATTGLTITASPLPTSATATETATATAIVSDLPMLSSSCDGIVIDDEDRDRIEKPRVSGKLDGWLRESVTDIVKNLKQAPLLVQIYADDVTGSTREVKTEKAVPEYWPGVIRESPSPDGIILIEELGEEEESVSETCEGITRAFGVLIQGRRGERECGESACYLLKTSRVRGGMGLSCTHFCLMKVNSLRKSAFSQLSDCWLLQK